MTPKTETAISKPLEAVEVRHQAGNCRACVPLLERVLLKGADVRKDLCRLTRGHDP